MRLSIFSASTSSSCARHNGKGYANDTRNTNYDANTGDDSNIRRGRRSVTSSSFEEPKPARSNHRRARGSGNADGNAGGYVSDSSKQSTETDAAVMALRSAGGYDLPDGLKGAGLLFVRYVRY